MIMYRMQDSLSHLYGTHGHMITVGDTERRYTSRVVVMDR